MNKLPIYFKINRGIEIFVVPVLFLLLVLGISITSNEIGINTIVGIYALMVPAMFIGITARFFTLEFHVRFWDLLSTYPEKKANVFWHKYLLALIIFAVPFSISLMLFGSKTIIGTEEYPSFSLMVFDVLVTTFFSAHLAMFFGVYSRRYEIGLVSAIILLVVILRIPWPSWVTWIVFPALGVLFLCMTFWIYTQRKE